MYIDSEAPKIYKEINSDNYLSNCYNHLTKIKGIHFFFILIEIILNIIQELETILRSYQLDFNEKNKPELNLVTFITIEFNKLKNIIKLIIMILFMIIFDSLYKFVQIKKITKKIIYITIIVNILEIFIYRTLTLIFFNLFFTIKKELFIIGCIFLIPHIILIFSNFLYNHLYYFVPVFIDYPYDEFSSLYDIIMLIIKLLSSVAGTTNNVGLSKFCFIIMLVLQIFFSFFFIYKLKNHSYLFMKNSFLNLTKLSFFIAKTIIIIIALVFGKNEIMSVLFLLIILCIILINMLYMYFIYNPFSNIIIKRETPMENTFFYLYILSENNDFNFVFENKVNAHYEKCGICDLCRKYVKYINRYKQNYVIIDEEKEKFINEENNKYKYSNKNKLMDLFDIIYDNKTQYFKLMKKLVLDYKNVEKECFFNNSYYFINLSFLIYSDYQDKNITLSLNERIILEVLNKENNSFLDNHESQISQIFLCNQFISLIKNIIVQLKDILKCEANLNKAKKLVDLSNELKKLQSSKFKKNLFSHKLENISNSRHLILICSVIYEEIYNTTLNNSQIPIRENIQPLEDIFYNNSNKINKIISLVVDLTNKTCKIIRAGKGLYPYINTNLFDLFPLIFKQYQIDLFMSSILEHFEIGKIDKKIVKKGTINNRLSARLTKSGLKTMNINKNKKDYIEIKLILWENIDSKVYFKLLTLKITPLFNNLTPYFILFDGLHLIHKNTIITLQDFEENINAKEKLISVSEPELEKNNETYSIPFKKYVIWQNNQGFNIQKISEFYVSSKLYKIYLIAKKENQIKKSERKNSQIRDDDDEEEFQTNIKKNTRLEKIQLMEDNASVSSQTAGSTFGAGISNLGIRNKKKESIFEYGGFNKIKTICFLAILTSIILLIIEYILLNKYVEETRENNTYYLDYKDFTKLYFQLFSSILSIACIYKDGKCIRIIDNYIDQYLSDKEYKFNYAGIIFIQSQILAEKMMQRRTILNNIHKCIGNEEYNKLFGKNMKYLRISQNIINQKYVFNLNSVNLEFSETLLSICNSFKLLTENINTSVGFLNGIDPFNYMNSLENNSYLSDYQKEFYEMILNYKNYYERFNEINDELNKIIISKSSIIEIFIYVSILIDTLMLEFIGSLMYFYTLLFEFILMKIINYINMTMNIKSDEFNFNETFSKKLDNLESILQFYNSDPVKGVQNLNSLYSNYQQYLSLKNKNTSEMNKKNYKKIEENKKNELDDIPKNQRIVTKKDVKSLGITSIYIIVYYTNLILILALFILLLLLWIDYFNNKRINLFKLFEKNNSVESIVYKAINVYDLMIFHNLTMEQVTNFVILDETKRKQENALLKNFYENLKYSFNNKKEKIILGDFFRDIEHFGDFSCKILYMLNRDNIKEIESKAKENNLPNIENVSDYLVQICEDSRVTDAKDYRTVFERHIQYTRNGIISLLDFSFDGLINYIKTEGTISKVSLFFNNIIIFLLVMTNQKPHQMAINQLITRLKSLVQISEIIFLIYNIIAILLVIFFYISGINNLCNKILNLKKIFKIYEIHE